MDFSLSSSLVGSAVSNPDKLALDLQFATDKTLTARKGPTPAFTRGSSATQVGASGLIEYAPENLILQSETLGTAWTLNNATISSDVIASPSGAVTADRIIENTAVSATHGIDQTITLTGVTHTFSFYAKKGERIWVRGFFGGLGSTWFNLDTGTIGTVDSGVSATMQSAGNGWWRCALTGVPTGTLHGIRIATGDTISSYTGDGVSGLYVWGAQIERSSIARAYNPTTTAAVYAPRFDHNPVSLACKGLLIEESRTNNCYNSNLLTTASWVLVGATIATSDTAPDGSAAFEITETAATSGHNISNSGGATGSVATSITGGVPYTLSVFVKKSTGSIDWIQLTGTGPAFGTAQYANFNLATGAIGNYTGVTSGTVPKMEQFPNGWWRCSITLTAIATATGNTGPVQLTNNTDTTTRAPSYLGSTANKVKVAMGQFEAGSFATSYIPNVASSGVIRSADVCSISGSDFTGMFNQSAGTLESKAMIANLIGNLRGITQIDDGTNANILRHIYGLSDGGFRSLIRSNSDTITALSVTLGAASTIQKRAIAYESTSFASVTNGGTVSTATRTMPVGLSTLRIGNIAEGSFYLSGHIASIRYYKKRLPNAKLASLTV